MNEQLKINWYRCKVEKSLMSELMKKRDWRGFSQVIAQLALFCATGLLAYAAYRNVHATNWLWALPVLFAALFIHGTFGSFMGGYGPLHELSHKRLSVPCFGMNYFSKFIPFLAGMIILDSAPATPNIINIPSITIWTERMNFRKPLIGRR
jgi:hypothetical protein